MSNIEDLLREALGTTPSPTPTVDPLGGLDRRIRRARRLMTVGATIGVAAVTAAVVVPLATLGGDRAGHLQYAGTPTPTPSVSASGIPGLEEVDVWTNSGATAVVTGGYNMAEEAWALVLGSNGSTETYQVVQLDPLTGAVENRIDVPGPVDFLAVGLDRVWAFGGGDGGYGNLSVVDRIDPGTGKVETLTINGKGGPEAMVFTAQSAFVSLAAANEVVKVGGMDGPLAQSQPVQVPGQPTQMVVSNDGTVWVNESLAKKWAHLSVGDGQSKVLGTESWSGPMFAAAPHDGIWTTDDPSRVVSITPSYLSAGVSVAYGYRIPTPGRPDAVAGSDVGDIYVIVSQGGGAPQQNGIAYYSARDVERESQHPTAFLPVDNVTSIAADPSGGVVFVDDPGSLRHWDPTQRPVLIGH